MGRPIDIPPHPFLIIKDLTLREARVRRPGMDGWEPFPVDAGPGFGPRDPSTPGDDDPLQLVVSGTALGWQLPILYGSRRITGAVIGPQKAGNTLVIAYLFCEGEVTLSDLQLNREPVAALPWVTYSALYGGSLTQTPDPKLQAAYGSDFEEAYVGTAYAVIEIDLTQSPSSMLPTATVQASRGNITDWSSVSRRSSNPIAALYEYLTNARYGRGLSPSDFHVASWTAAADWCDETVGTEYRWSINGTVSGASELAVIDLIRKHCFATLPWWWDGKLRISTLGPLGSAAATITDGDLLEGAGWRYRRVPTSQRPTSVTARFWDEDLECEDTRRWPETWPAPDDLRELEEGLELCTSAAMARRWAAQRYLTGTLETIEMMGRVRDGVAADLAPGDRVDIASDALGLTSTPFRVLRTRVRPGVTELSVRIYDASAQSDADGSGTTPPSVDPGGTPQAPAAPSWWSEVHAGESDEDTVTITRTEGDYERTTWRWVAGSGGATVHHWEIEYLYPGSSDDWRVWASNIPAERDSWTAGVYPPGSSSTTDQVDLPPSHHGLRIVAVAASGTRAASTSGPLVASTASSSDSTGYNAAACLGKTLDTSTLSLTLADTSVPTWDAGSSMWKGRAQGSGGGLDADMLDGKHASDLGGTVARGTVAASGSFSIDVSSYGFSSAPRVVLELTDSYQTGLNRKTLRFALLETVSATSITGRVINLNIDTVNGSVTATDDSGTVHWIAVEA